MLHQRLKSAAVLLTVAVTLLVLDAKWSVGIDGVWLMPLLMFFAIGTAWELSTILLNGGPAGEPGVRRGVAVIGATMVSLSAGVPMLWPAMGSSYPVDCPVGRLGWIVLATAAAIALAFLAEMRHYGKSPIAVADDNHESDRSSEKKQVSFATGDTIRRTCAAVFVSVYVGVPMAMLVATRTMHPGGWGLAALITTIAVTKSTDVGAYFVGRLLGRNKLIPRLSPGKTREGAVGGIVTATIVAFACLKWLFPALTDQAAAVGATSPLASPIWGAVVLGPALAVSGMIGDLAESLFKRDGGVKDSGSLLPGMGGVWDVTDSLIAASIPAFFCFASGVGS
ncbi:phosphatidate cytidylyltransferase [Stieleria varia]|uniref:Phosphatidate cytidylyltransferase n=1 Tax=Stieleria varia TaxID=2528005 RepID=A0A5C6AXE8_9BACT|nr:phosphatidate cytidylyltransferase [Stieleria varia]TWU04613.1 Phosphatidate cytidylyltransferase [Stieleria varia]